MFLEGEKSLEISKALLDIELFPSLTTSFHKSGKLKWSAYFIGCSSLSLKILPTYDALIMESCAQKIIQHVVVTA